MSKNRSSAHVNAQRNGRLRDGNVCQICGSTDHVEGHHIIDHQFNGAALADNIISLCHKHHKEVNQGKIDILKF